ncbi:hypothetical protein DFH06DRAFT_54137 [Mycena polygramma]|nr:hypothetical protein DFH06DRAFT_54137 [Mycena polygramma]
MPSNITSSRNEPHNSQTPCIARDEPTPASPEWKRPCHKPEDRSGAPASRLMLPTVAAVSPALLPSVPGESFAKFYRPRPAKAAPAPQCLLHPPFTDLPDGVVLPEGMNYSVMHHHPNWVLDVNDYIALDRKRKGTVPYPRDLQAPPLKLRTKLGHLQIRCTFCVKSYAGANASSLWKRHVREKHNILLKRRYLAPRPKERCKFLGNN